MEQWNKGNWTSFFTTVGKNPLPVYLFSELFIVISWWIPSPNGKGNITGWIIENVFMVIAPGKIGSLLFAIFYMLLCWCFGKLLDRNKIYLRL